MQVPPGVQHRSDSMAHLCGVGKSLYGVEDRTLVIANKASRLALLVKKKKNYHEYNGGTKENVCRGSHYSQCVRNVNYAYLLKTCS